ncbi:U3 snoRNP protein Utp20 [Schizosaccharomyces cryophilus OY26]|uniref:U3 snoRNP protein Utp20 n=1 Tax=Schizosaccharomyces cryophilus (strain OY26 / ATCC MYA-4695 / CBS 11777 / NBRC 106824 / NRRL Y48691) TaxID=653667 RepID=S9W4Q5_SCHCR|nr:U3 snoRNP protein Utp20 [Schizosaccharomyces cryophilus OY26]EPY53504.1 U3 snoRNP protein Utp20 [Schizosaccharomyces cryophilus OY26]
MKAAAQNNSTKNYVFLPFSKRVDNLKIDVAHKVRRAADIEDENLESYFISCLNKWVDLNLSTHFTNFFREVSPYTQSLPQLIFHQQTVFSILEKYAGEGNSLSLQPLLELITQFARDLTTEFAVYVDRTLILLSQLVRSTELEVVDWSFHAVAYLFKYLRKILIPQLTHIYDILSPLLGKQKEKAHVIRFTSEALSFLCRLNKEDAAYQFVHHVISDLNDNYSSQYLEGIVILFARIIEGVGSSVHSKGITFVRILLDPSIYTLPKASSVCVPVFISIIHHATVESFVEVQDILIQKIMDNPSLYISLFVTVVATRKGAKLSNISAFLEAYTKLMETTVWESAEYSFLTLVYQLAAYLITYPEVAVVIPYSTRILSFLQQGPPPLFLSFADFIQNLNHQRYVSFIKPALSKYVSSNPNLDLIQIAVMEITFDTGVSLTPSIFTMASESLKKASLLTKGGDPLTEHELAPAWSQLIVLSSSAVDKVQLYESCVSVLEKIKSLSSPSLLYGNIVGLILRILNEKANSYLKENSASMQKLLNLVLPKFELYSSSKFFLENLIPFAAMKTVSFKESMDSIINCLLKNLVTGAYGLRSVSINLLLTIYENVNGQYSAPLLHVRDLIEMPLSPSTSRDAVVLARNVVSKINLLSLQDRKVALFSLIGCIMVRFTPVWKDFAKAIVSVLNKELEGEFMKIMFTWLSCPKPPSNLLTEEQQSILHFEPAEVNYLSTLDRYEFTCPSFASSEETFGTCLFNFQEPQVQSTKDLLKSLEDDYSNLPSYRSQGLRILNESSDLVYSYIDRVDEYLFSLQHGFELNTDWSRQDIYMLLGLYSHLQGQQRTKNAEKRRELLLWALSVSDSKVQSSALDALLCYKDESLNVYEENLKNLLDDKKFRDELTTFLFISPEDSIIQEPHRLSLMPVVISILYGKMTSAAYGGQKNQNARRSTVLSTLGNMRISDLELLIGLMLRPYQELPRNIIHETDPLGIVKSLPMVSLRRQIGFLSMVEELLKQISSKLTPVAPMIISAVLYSLLSADQLLVSSTDSRSPDVKLSHTIRHNSLKVYLSFLKFCPEVNIGPYNAFLYKYFVQPKLPKFATENTQSVSTLMQIFKVWFENTNYLSSILDFGSSIMMILLDVICQSTVKIPVILFVFEVLNSVILHAQSDDVEEHFRQKITSLMVLPNIKLIFNNLSDVLGKPIFADNSRVLDGSVVVLTNVSKFISSELDSSRLLDLLVPFLKKPKRLVPNSVKANILELFACFLPNNKPWVQASLAEPTSFETLMQMYAHIEEPSSRRSLNGILRAFSNVDSDLTFGSVFVEEVNSFSQKRLDEPDFERRLSAFTSLNEKHYANISNLTWLPVLYNCFFFIRDEDELSIRSSASLGIKRFIDTISLEDTNSDFKSTLFQSFILPNTKTNMKHKNEFIRQEFVSLLNYSVLKLPSFESISDMRPLLFDGDEEANFFNNILHIQLHRRRRAMRRLAGVCDTGVIKSSNISHIFLPLLEHFCFTLNIPQTLIDDTVLTIGDIAKWLQWNQYQAILKRYIGLLKNASIDQKIVIRLINALVTALRPLDVAISSYHKSDEMDMEIDNNDTLEYRNALTDSLPDTSKLSTCLDKIILPPLLLYLHIREESTVMLRVSIALSIVQLVALLPDEEIALRLPPVLIDTCHILRSRSQESRDATRKTLSSIAKVLGPKYFSFILNQLRLSLQRGYQLHVLGYTVHSLLVSVEDVYPYGSLDYCLDNLSTIFVSEIFGEVGLEKDAEEYKSNVKEIKGNKSFDSYEIVARMSGIESLGILLRPVKNVLSETTYPRSLRKVDELSRRLSMGVMANKQSMTQKALIFCYNVFDYVSKQNAAMSVSDIHEEQRMPNLFAKNSKKLVRFALDALRGIVTKHKELLTSANMTGFVPIIGDSLLSDSEELNISALRIIVVLLPLKMAQVFSGSTVFISQAIKLIQNSPTTNSELCQASLKFIASILPYEGVEIKESALSYLLERISGDIEEPDRQGVMFSLVRASITRKAMSPELYKLMDKIRDMMVTNHTKSTRQTCRHLYYAFLLDFPQGKTRFAKQMSFILKNLEYEFAPGRESIMELLHAILNNFSDTLLKEYLHGIFLALVMVLVNDPEPHCRELSAELIKNVFQRVDEESYALIRQLLFTWISKKSNTAKNLHRVGMQLFGLLFEIYGFEKTQEVEVFTGVLIDVLQTAINKGDDALDEWEMLYFGLQSWLKLVIANSVKACSRDYAQIWTLIRYVLLFKHAWVRLSVSRLYGYFFALTGNSSFNQVKLKASEVEFGLDFVLQISNAMQAQLRSSSLSEELGTQVVKNLVFLTRWFNTIRKENSEPFLDIFRRMYKSLRKQKVESMDLSKKYMIQWFVIVIRLFSSEELLPVLRDIISALYRYTELNEAEKKIQQELVDIVIESLDVLQSKVGTTEYVNAYQEVRQASLDVRRERREKRAIEQVVDPEIATKKKLRKYERKHDVRKERTQHQRMLNAVFKKR